jgi:hypothetical protein
MYLLQMWLAIYMPAHTRLRRWAVQSSELGVCRCLKIAEREAKSTGQGCPMGGCATLLCRLMRETDSTQERTVKREGTGTART